MKHIEAEIFLQHANNGFRNPFKQLINQSNQYVAIFINYMFGNIVITVGFTRIDHVSQLLHKDEIAHPERVLSRNIL